MTPTPLADLIIANPPKIHRPTHGGDGALMNWAFTDDLLRWTERRCGPQVRSLETGSGATTAICGALNQYHAAIDPTPGIWARIQEYARQVGIPGVAERTLHVPMRSEFALPAMAQSAPASYDLIILDGSHTMPTPFIDWFYLSLLLKVGGRMLVDDAYKLAPCRFLMEWMRTLPEWKQEDQIGRAAPFVKLAPTEHPDRFEQDAPFTFNFDFSEKA